MSNSVLRICVWVLSIISLAGNVLVIIWRIFYRTNNRVSTNNNYNTVRSGIVCSIVFLVLV